MKGVGYEMHFCRFKALSLEKQMPIRLICQQEGNQANELEELNLDCKSKHTFLAINSTEIYGTYFQVTMLMTETLV